MRKVCNETVRIVSGINRFTVPVITNEFDILEIILREGVLEKLHIPYQRLKAVFVIGKIFGFSVTVNIAESQTGGVRIIKGYRELVLIVITQTERLLYLTGSLLKRKNILSLGKQVGNGPLKIGHGAVFPRRKP